MGHIEEGRLTRLLIENKCWEFDIPRGKTGRGWNEKMKVMSKRILPLLLALFPASPIGLLIRGDTLYISDTFARKVLTMLLR